MTLSLRVVDRIEIFVLMDNVSDPFTTTHPNLHWNESVYRSSVLDKHECSGADFCRACNGLSLLLKIYSESDVKTVLFDAGPDQGLIVDNARRMEVDLSEVDASVISHGHFDHYGGILSALDAIGKQDLPVYSHPDLFAPRAFGKNKLTTVSYNLTNMDIAKHGGKVIESRDPLLLFDDALLISGEVPRKTSYESGSPTECRKKDGKWVASPDVVDERVIILNMKDRGLCVFTACGHTGVINAVNYAKEITGIGDVHLIMGGLHLAPTSISERIMPTISDLQLLDPNYIVTGHCTGAHTQAELSQFFRSKHIRYGVGAVFNFTA